MIIVLDDFRVKMSEQLFFGFFFKYIINFTKGHSEVGKDNCPSGIYFGIIFEQALYTDILSFTMYLHMGQELWVTHQTNYT